MLFLSVLAACEQEGEETTGTVDVQVDQNKEDAKVESSAPVTCMGSGNREFIAWQDDRNGKDAIFLNLTADGKTFMPGDVQISHGEATATNPAIACSGEHIYVVWEDERDGDYKYRNIYLNYSDDSGATWQPDDIMLDGDIDGEHISKSPQITTAGSAVYVAWYDNGSGAYDILVQASTNNGKEWMDEPSRADTDAAGEAYSANPRIVADTDGNVVVVWEDSRSGKNDIYANASGNFGKSFAEADTRLDGGDEAGANDSFLTSVAMAGQNVYAVWQDERYGDGRDVLFSASDDAGERWSEDPVRVDSDGEGLSDSLNAVVVAQDDSAHVVFQDNRSGGYDIFYRRTDDGGESWSADEARLDTDEPGIAQSYEPAMTLGADGTVVVGWRDGRSDAKGVGVNDLIYNYSVDGGKSFQGQDIRINSTAPGLTYAEDLSLSLVNGNLYSVWADGRHGTTDIFFANRELGASSVYIAPEETE